MNKDIISKWGPNYPDKSVEVLKELTRAINSLYSLDMEYINTVFNLDTDTLQEIEKYGISFDGIAEKLLNIRSLLFGNCFANWKNLLEFLEENNAYKDKQLRNIKCENENE